ncbi:unnamed protein product [Pleuronectes platessa]|uniref:Uncharacterized protein n=1 Tax=Pleuronectes platessa TaxID=8262 RepID=A0A9N7TM84_PLEPL|nr:unnamed protein product [Pleuronectes platessa]
MTGTALAGFLQSQHSCNFPASCCNSPSFSCSSGLVTQTQLSSNMDASALSGMKLSINGDGDFMKEQKLIPYPASSLLIVTSTGPEEEAGPLPSKVDLDQSNI